MANDVSISGLPALLRKLEQPRWLWLPTGRFLDRWAETAERQAKANLHRPGDRSWYWRGGVERSIRATYLAVLAWRDGRWQLTNWHTTLLDLKESP